MKSKEKVSTFLAHILIKSQSIFRNHMGQMGKLSGPPLAPKIDTIDNHFKNIFFQNLPPKW